MTDKLTELAVTIERLVESKKAELLRLETEIRALALTKEELAAEIKDWPAQAAEYRRMKEQARKFADSIDALGH